MGERDREPMIARALACALSVVLGACSNGVAVDLTPATPPAPTEPEALPPERIWAITQGGCGDSSPVVTASGPWGTLATATIGPGRHCVRTLLLARFERATTLGPPPCRALAAGSTEITTPAQGTIVIEEREIAPAARPALDGLTSALGACDPQRDPARCPCAYSPSGDGACTAAVSGAVLDVGDEHGCAATLDGRLVCWGRAGSFDPTGGDAYVGPTEVTLPADLLGSIEALALGTGLTCAQTHLGAVGCVGDGLDAELASPPRSTPSGGAVVFDLFTAGDGFWCGTRVARGSIQLVCDGRGGPVPDGVIDVSTLPSLVSLAAGAAHVCAADASGSVHCLGDGSRGQLGSRTASSATLVPIELPPCGGDTTWLEVVASHDVSCAQNRRGSVACWGGGRAPACVGTDGVGATSALSRIRLDGDVLCGEITQSSGTTCTSVVGCSNRDWNDCPRVLESAEIRAVAVGGGLACGTSGEGTLACLPTQDPTPDLLEAVSRASSERASPPVCPVDLPR